MIIQILILFILLNTVALKTTPCNLRLTNHGAVCVCTSDYCDYLDNPKPIGHEFIAISSTKSGLRFATTNGVFENKEKYHINDFYKSAKLPKSELNTAFDPLSLKIESDGTGVLELANGPYSRSFFSIQNPYSLPVQIIIDRKKHFQKMVGFGGALTGSVSHILNQLKTELQDQIYKTFFHETGIGFNLLRMSIGGCDFDLEPWAYNELPVDDAELTNFTKLDQRDELKVQQLKRLHYIAEIEKLKIMAAAWSAPKWMKSNNEWTGFGFLKTEYYQTWANYHLRFLELMASKNMSIWAISTGNEPLNGVIGWFFVRFMSMGWTPSEQAIWLSEHLGPTIKESKHKDVLIFGNDDQRYTYPAWFRKMNASRSNALDYLDGLAVHWYWDDLVGPELTIDIAHNEMPDKLLLTTESCIGDKPWQTHGPELGSWERGEQYVRTFMQNLQHSCSGWIDWNILLNEIGGPNYVANYVDAPVIVNTTTGQEFYKQPIFYGIGHFSKFISAESVRINTKVSNISLNIDAVGFQRPDGSIAVIVSNSGQIPMDIKLIDSQQGILNINIPARSVHTFIYN